MWLFFTLATTLIWGLAELFYKKGARPDEKFAHLKITVCVGVVMGLHAIFTLCTQDIGYDPMNLIRYLPVSLCYIISMAFSFFGMRFIEESISDPIENTSGALCSLMCVIFLGESLSKGSIAAILIIVVGILGLGFLENTGSTNRKKKIGKKLAIIAFAMPFCYAILDALGSFLDIYFLEMETSPLVHINEDTIEQVANTSYELTFAMVALVLLIFMKIKKVKFELPKQRDKVLAAVCETAGQFTYVFAMSGNGAIAAPIISAVCVVSLIFSRIFLKEKLTWKQYLFLALVIIGILTLAIIEGE
ncbi:MULTISPECIES: DMT family transporter [Agathobacter]|uniref:EamA family transporter n=1 Tax=Agathobacter ruminis TaxID=1712665 RepID=A0A2G3E440_9FIRM|nr:MULTISPECIES: DMT family transporter [Agathobacter]MBQ1680603.1 DMT family transporter [Agathobacter sp.]MCR5676520.1 DMT family transporter [Agathobacter sp.]MDC7301816.1 DMT family transporter [Agathobacter ruminis]PHU38029.1 EamA family transporter [Agathobacter ruminis]